MREQKMYYHVWFVTKYRKETLVGDIEKKIRELFSESISRHNYNVLEFEANINHVHMLVEAKDRKELSAIVRTLKAVSAKEINATPRFRVGNDNVGFYRRKPVEGRSSFWARRYAWKEVFPKDIEIIREYIRNQKRIPHTEVRGGKSSKLTAEG